MPRPPIDAIAAAPRSGRRHVRGAARLRPPAAGNHRCQPRAAGARADQARTLPSALADALRRRGVTDPTAGLAAEAGIAVFKIAFEEWIHDQGDRTLSEDIRAAADELRQLTGGRGTTVRR